MGLKQKPTGRGAHLIDPCITIALAELVRSATPLRSYDAMDVASGRVPDGAAFVRRRATSPCEAALRSLRSRVGRYIGPRRQSARLTYSAGLNKGTSERQEAPKMRLPRPTSRSFCFANTNSLLFLGGATRGARNVRVQARPAVEGEDG